MPWAEWYWAWIGSPLSIGIGYVSDAIPFPLSELLLCLGLCSVALVVGQCFRMDWAIKFSFWPSVGVVCLVIQAFSQGATPVDFVPTVFREAVSGRVGRVEVQLEPFEAAIERAQGQLLSFPEHHYISAPDHPPLALVNAALDQTLAAAAYPKGREVKSWKPMMGLTQRLGLAYGGPAYHDVLTAEVVIASHADLPSRKAWKWLTLIHEVAHAKGFTREMDAEVLTFLALEHLDHPMAPLLSSWMLLIKSGRSFDMPDFLKDEALRLEKERKALNQPLVQGLKRLARFFQIQNHAAKYGQVQAYTPPANHEFFGVVLHPQRRSFVHQP